MIKSWQEYIEHHQSRKGWSDARLAKEFGLQTETIRAWKGGNSCGHLRLVVRASHIFGERWNGASLGGLGWLLVELQEKHEINTNVLTRRGVSKRTLHTLRTGGCPTFVSLCKIFQAFRLSREELKEVLHEAYQIILEENQQ